MKPRHALPSIIASLDDDTSTQNSQHLIEVCCKAAIAAIKISIPVDHDKPDAIYYNVFPGEHYKLLAGLLEVINPKLVIDIGTFTGMSANVMVNHRPKPKVHTFDIIPYNDFNTHLKSSDFATNEFEQHLCDLSNPSLFNQYAHLIDRSDLIFCDAPKDSVFEYKFLKLLAGMNFTNKNRYLILDDIRFNNMFEIWRSIKSPKLDITSIAHWSGTGIVDLSNGFSF